MNRFLFHACGTLNVFFAILNFNSGGWLIVGGFMNAAAAIFMLWRTRK